MMMQASDSNQQVVALKQQIQQLQCNWHKAQQDVEKLSRQLWSKPSQVALLSRCLFDLECLMCLAMECEKSGEVAIISFLL